jgi:HlyD family secretion protein
MKKRTPILGLVLLATIPLSACGNGKDVPAVGTLERDRYDLVAEAYEPIAQIMVKEGDHVTAGQPLLQLATDRIAAQRMNKAGLLAQAKGRLAELERGPRKEVIEQQRAELAGAEATVTTAKRELDRISQLATQDFQTKSALDAQRNKYETAVAARNAARATLAASLNGTTPEELEQAAAAVDAAQGALDDIAKEEQRYTITAPVDGVIDSLPYRLGERPRAGDTVIVMLKGGNPYARVYVPAAVRPEVKPGVMATVHVEGYTKPFQGRVRMVADDAAFTPFYALTEYDRGRLSYLSKIDLVEDKSVDLPTGLPVQVTFGQGTK